MALSTFVNQMSDEKSQHADKHPVFIQPSTGSTGGSNPTPEHEPTRAWQIMVIDFSA
jgi:hypothetical protein